VDAPGHGLGFLDAKFGQPVLFEEVIQRFYNIEILCLRIAPPKPSRLARAFRSLSISHRLGQMA
jgi:hypothetical protein